MGRWGKGPGTENDRGGGDREKGTQFIRSRFVLQNTMRDSTAFLILL